MKHWKRWPSRSVKDSCAPGCGRSTAADQPPSGQPARFTWPVSSVTHAPARGWLSFSIAGCHADSCRPSSTWRTRVGQWVAEGEADLCLAAGVSEVVARASRIGAGEHVSIERAHRELLEHQIKQLKVVICVVGAGVPGPEDPREDLPPAGHQ